jgi:hypothetical protein
VPVDERAMPVMPVLPVGKGDVGVGFAASEHGGKKWIYPRSVASAKKKLRRDVRNPPAM